LLVFDGGLGNPLPHRIVKEPAPGPPARALQIDDSNLAVGGQQIDFRRLKHFAT
jgi:hypothetical protein